MNPPRIILSGSNLPPLYCRPPLLFLFLFILAPPPHNIPNMEEYRIPRFTGQAEYVLSADATLTSMTNQKAWSRPPLSLSFSLLMFTSSGLLVRYLKVFEKSNYSSVKWVRYMTRAGSYEIRCVISHPSPLPAPSPLMVPQSLPHTTPHTHEHRDKFVCQITCVHLSRHAVLNSDSNVRILGLDVAR